MKKFSPSAFFRGRFPLAIVAGLILAASFPNIGIAGFAWVAPGLILATALGKRGAEASRIGYVAGLAHYLASLYWLLNIPAKGFPILGWVALALFLALFPAMWVRMCLPPTLDPRPSSTTWLDAVKQLSALPWSARMSWAFRSAAAWVAMEMILARIFGGFPWNLLADSQYRIVPLLQFASFTGVYGISFLVVWTSISLLCGVITILGKPTHRSPWMAEIIFPFTAIVAAFVFGFHQLSQPVPSARELKVTLVQPGIPQTLIWNPANDMARFHDLLRLSEEALTNETDVLIWPEAAMPGLPRFQSEFGEPISDLARQHKVWMIIGTDDAEATPLATNYFNASFLINPEGKLASDYRKRGLVIFGEYIPFENSLPFIKWFTPITGSYTPGTNAVQFNLERRALARHDSEPGQRAEPVLGAPARFQTSVLICFEDVFPHLTRKSVEPDTDFLVNITNDGWFGEGAAQWQQAAAATFRTVENGVPLIRCSNTGVTCWIDANGRWQKKLTDKNDSVYKAGFMTATIPLAARHPQTFYNLHGDCFGWACTTLAAMILVAQLVSQRTVKAP